MSGMMDPAFKNKVHQGIREARLELQGKLLLAFCDQELMGQCPILHPLLRRHFDQLERIHGLNIINKEWMIREAESIGESIGAKEKQETDQETKGGSGLDQQAASGPGLDGSGAQDQKTPGKKGHQIF